MANPSSSTIPTDDVPHVPTLSPPSPPSLRLRSSITESHPRGHHSNPIIIDEDQQTAVSSSRPPLHVPPVLSHDGGRVHTTLATIAAIRKWWQQLVQNALAQQGISIYNYGTEKQRREPIDVTAPDPSSSTILSDDIPYLSTVSPSSPPSLRLRSSITESHPRGHRSNPIDIDDGSQMDVSSSLPPLHVPPVLNHETNQVHSNLITLIATQKWWEGLERNALTQLDIFGNDHGTARQRRELIDVTAPGVYPGR